MQNLLVVFHLLVTVALIGLVLVQRSEGGALGIGGGSGNLFTSRGVGNALTRATAFLAVCFFATSIALAVLATRKGGSIFDSVAPSTQQAPAGSNPDAGGPVHLPDLGGQTSPAQPAQPAAPTGQ